MRGLFVALLTAVIILGLPVALLVYLIRKRKRREREERLQQPAFGSVPLYAGFWRRAVALFIDSLILMVPMWGISLLMLNSLFTTSDFSSPYLYLTQAGLYLLSTAYYVIFLASAWQATPGKRMMGVYVSSEDGRRIGMGRALARYVVFHAPMLMMAAYMFTMTPLQQPFAMSPQDQAHMTSINQKMLLHQPITAEDQQFMDQVFKPARDKLNADMGMSTEEQEHLNAINAKQRNHETLTPEEQQFSTDESLKMAKHGFKLGGIGLLLASYSLLIALMIGLTREKTGLHDVICKTRARRGRPESPIMA